MSLRILSPAAFMALEPPTLVHLINPIIPLGGVVFVYGKSGVGKSPFSWGLADAVATGGPFCGMKTLKAPVLYIDVDTRWWVIQHRWRMANYRPTFHIAEGDAFDCLDGMWYFGNKVRELLREANEKFHPKMVIVSTLAKIHPFAYSDPSAPLQVYKRWQELFDPECAIVFIHHDKKSSHLQGEIDEDTAYHLSKEAFSGASQWMDHCTTAIHLTRAGNDYRFGVTQTKDQGSEKVKSFEVVLEKDGVHLTIGA